VANNMKDVLKAKERFDTKQIETKNGTGKEINGAKK